MDNCEDDDDAVEVISLFKCRMCTFTSVASVDIKRHIWQVHRKKKAQDTDQKQSPFKSDCDLNGKKLAVSEGNINSPKSENHPRTSSYEPMVDNKNINSHSAPVSDKNNEVTFAGNVKADLTDREINEYDSLAVIGESCCVGGVTSEQTEVRVSNGSERCTATTNDTEMNTKASNRSEVVTMTTGGGSLSMDEAMNKDYKTHQELPVTVSLSQEVTEEISQTSHITDSNMITSSVVPYNSTAIACEDHMTSVQSDKGSDHMTAVQSDNGSDHMTSVQSDNGSVTTIGQYSADELVHKDSEITTAQTMEDITIAISQGHDIAYTDIIAQESQIMSHNSIVSSLQGRNIAHTSIITHDDQNVPHTTTVHQEDHTSMITQDIINSSLIDETSQNEGISHMLEPSMFNSSSGQQKLVYVMNTPSVSQESVVNAPMELVSMNTPSVSQESVVNAPMELVSMNTPSVSQESVVNAPMELVSMGNQTIHVQDYLDKQSTHDGFVAEGYQQGQIVRDVEGKQPGVIDVIGGPTGQRFVLLTGGENEGQSYISSSSEVFTNIGQGIDSELSAQLHGTTNMDGTTTLVSMSDFSEASRVSDGSNMIITNLPNGSGDVLKVNDAELEGQNLTYHTYVQNKQLTNEQGELSMPGWISQEELASGNFPVTETKELFLCGLCNTGFITMELCKAHIEQKHHLDNDEDGTDISQQQQTGNKCSIGVQAVQNRGAHFRGRGRRKINVMEVEPGAVKEETGEKEQESLAEEVCEDDEFRTDILGKRPMNKRRIKTPKHLLDEYFIGKKKPGMESSELRNPKPMNWDDIGLKPRKNKRRKKMIEAESTDGVQTQVTGDGEKQEVDGRTETGVGDGQIGDIQGNITAEVCGIQTGENITMVTDGIGENTGVKQRDENNTMATDNTGENTDLMSEDEKDGEYLPTKTELEHQSEDEESSEEQVEESIYPTKEEMTGLPPEKKANKPRKERILKGERLVPKLDIPEDMKTPKHTYTVRCKYKSCRGKFLTKESYQLHLKCHRRRPGRVCYVCSECKVTFSTWSSCRYHLWKEHKIDVDLYSCDTCNFKTDMACKLDIHKVVHLDDRPYICKECGRGFKQPGQLRNHEVLHEQLQAKEEENAWFQKKLCVYCEKEFANSKSLKNHITVVHGKVRPYTCPHCSHTTSIRAALQLHMRTHTGEKPYTCDMCTFAASDHNTLRRHRMRHTGERPYKCPYCPYSSIQSIALKTHIKNKHSDQDGGMYQCALCEFTTVNKSLYTTHMSDHEKGVPTATAMARRRGRAPVTSRPSKPPTKFACAKCLFSTTEMSVLVAHVPTCPAKRKPVITVKSQSILRQAVSAVFGGGGRSGDNTVIQGTTTQDIQQDITQTAIGGTLVSGTTQDIQQQDITQTSIGGTLVSGTTATLVSRASGNIVSDMTAGHIVSGMTGTLVRGGVGGTTGSQDKYILVQSQGKKDPQSVVINPVVGTRTIIINGQSVAIQPVTKVTDTVVMDGITMDTSDIPTVALEATDDLPVVSSEMNVLEIPISETTDQKTVFSNHSSHHTQNLLRETSQEHELYSQATITESIHCVDDNTANNIRGDNTEIKAVGDNIETTVMSDNTINMLMGDNAESNVMIDNKVNLLMGDNTDSNGASDNKDNVRTVIPVNTTPTDNKSDEVGEDTQDVYKLQLKSEPEAVTMDTESLTNHAEVGSEESRIEVCLNGTTYYVQSMEDVRKLVQSAGPQDTYIYAADGTLEPISISQLTDEQMVATQQPYLNEHVQ